MNTAIRLVAGLVLIGALVACGQADTTTDATAEATFEASPAPAGTGTPEATSAATADEGATPEGWERITVAEGGFSLAVPDDWEPISADDIGDSGVMEEMLDANPEAATAIQQAQAAIAGGQIALFVFDASEASVGSGFAANLNVIPVGPVGSSAEDAAEEIAAAVEEQVPVTGEVTTEAVTLPAGDAALIGYEWTVAGPDGTSTDVRVTQYAIIGERGGYILSMSAATEAAGEYEETFRLIAESFVEEG